MAVQSKIAKFVDCYGPDSVICHANFTVPTGGAAITVNEAQGCNVARTALGTYVVTFARGWKAINVTLGLESASAVTTFVVTAKDSAARTVTLKAVTAGSATVVDPTVAATVNIQAIIRKAI